MADTDSTATTTTIWAGGDGRWGDPGSWSNGVPTLTTIASFAAGTVAAVAGDGAAGELDIAGTVSIADSLSDAGALVLGGKAGATLGADAVLVASGPLTESSPARLLIAGELESGGAVVEGVTTVQAGADDAAAGQWQVDGTLEIAGGVVTVATGAVLDTNGITVRAGGSLLLDPGAAVTGAAADGGSAPGLTLDGGTLYTGDLSAAQPERRRCWRSTMQAAAASTSSVSGRVSTGSIRSATRPDRPLRRCGTVH